MPTMPALIVEESRALPIVHFSVALKTGALADPADRAGLTRIAARLMRRSAGGRSSEVVDIELDRLGASFGVDVHATSVLFHGVVIRRSLAPLLDLVEDALVRPGLGDDAFGQLVRESQAELVDARDDDRSLAQYWFRRELFPEHALAIPVAGTPKSLARLTPADARAWHKERLRRSDLVISFAGDIQPREAEAFAARLARVVPEGSSARALDTEPRLPDGRRLVVVDKPERTQTQILIGTRGTHPSDPDHTALGVANTAFGGTFSARLMQEIRGKRGWSYGAYSSLPYDNVRRAFSIWTFPAAKDAAACIRLELELLEAFCKSGITEEELDRAKSYLVRSNAFTKDTAQKRAGLLLDEALHGLPAGYHERLIERVNAVTLDDTRRAVETRISSKNLLVLAVATYSELGAELSAAVEGVSSARAIPYDRED